MTSCTEEYHCGECSLQCCKERLAELQLIEAAARNLVAAKGRHHTEIAMRRLVEVLAPNAELRGRPLADGPA